MNGADFLDAWVIGGAGSWPLYESERQVLRKSAAVLRAAHELNEVLKRGDIVVHEQRRLDIALQNLEEVAK